jgi:hypothetical protein
MMRRKKKATDMMYNVTIVFKMVKLITASINAMIL